MRNREPMPKTPIRPTAKFIQINQVLVDGFIRMNALDEDGIVWQYVAGDAIADTCARWFPMTNFRADE